MTGELRRCAVLGHPIGHSLSPALHRAAYAWLGLDWTYEACDVTAAGLPAFVARLDSSWRGLSLTMPLKRAVLPLLATVDPVAALAGAANTVVVDEGGLAGSNTDVPGMLDALAEVGVVPGPDGDGRGSSGGRSCLVLGGGATAASAVLALGRLAPRDVAVAVRDPSRAVEVLDLAAACGLAAHAVPLGSPAAWGRPDLVVSTLPGTAADDAAGAVADCLTLGATVFDVVYDGWPTPLARAAAVTGATVVSGGDLLVHQARGQVRAFTGREVPVAVLRAALPAVLRETRARPPAGVPPAVGANRPVGT